MTSARNSRDAVQRLANATLALYAGVGRVFLFQCTEAFTGQVADFLAARPRRPRRFAVAASPSSWAATSCPQMKLRSYFNSRRDAEGLDRTGFRPLRAFCRRPN